VTGEKGKADSPHRYQLIQTVLMQQTPRPRAKALNKNNNILHINVCSTNDVV
jgi:hypothetical protein